jgi:flavin reductase (DIM6/NTAB) family NADH-FMN oxidoreductase RutF
MDINPDDMAPKDIYRYLIGAITPRPIAWVSTLSPVITDASGTGKKGGLPNLAPYSFFNGVGANPPSVVFCPVNRRDGSPKDTLINIEATKEFVVNIVPFSLAQPMNESSAELAYEESEFELTGLDQSPSVKIKVPRVKAATIHLECVLQQVIHLGEGPLGANLVIGRIVWMSIADSVLDERQEIDPRKLDTVGRMGGMYYTRTTELFELPRPSAK